MPSHHLQTQENTNSMPVTSAHIAVLFAIGFAIILVTHFVLPHPTPVQTTWPTARGTVTHFWQEWRSSGKSSRRVNHIEYEYTVDGFKRTRRDEDCGTLYTGDAIYLRYPPGKPEAAVVAGHESTQDARIFGYIGGAFILFIASLLAYFKQKN